MRRVATVIQRLECADRSGEAHEVRRGVGDLRFPVGIDVAESDAAEARIAGRRIAAGGADAEQGHVVEDGVLAEQTDVAAELERTPARIAERQEFLTSI